MSSYTDLTFHIHAQPALSSAIDPRITYTEHHGSSCIPVSVHNTVDSIGYANAQSLTEHLSQILGTCMPEFIPEIEQFPLPVSTISNSPTSSISDTSDTYAFEDPPYLSLLNRTESVLATPATSSQLGLSSTSILTAPCIGEHVSYEYTDNPSFNLRSTTSNSLRKRRDAVFVAREYFEAMIATPSTQEFENSANCGIPSHAVSEANTVSFDGTFSKIKARDTYHDDERENYPKGYGSEINTILYGWLLKHTNNPYPSLNDKKILMQKTGLTKMQLKNWFCNMRRRKLKDTIRRTKKRSKFQF